MAQIGFPVSLRGYHFEDSVFTFNLATGITLADAGKAVALDSTGPTKVKLAGDGDTIIGRLETVENRVQEGILVGGVALRFANLLPIKAGLAGADVVAIGKTVVGAGAGEVKAAAAADYSLNFVSEIVGTFAVVAKVS